MNNYFNITILVAPLDWGLGHASRCIPLVKHLLQLNCKVILAASGPQRKLLETEFPHLQIEHLDGYNISYGSSKRWFSFKIIYQLPKILNAIKKEQQWLNTIIKKHNINAIISDNRYGLYHPTIPVAFITHQLNIKSPFSWSEPLIRKLHYRLINRFTYCWVPDVEETPNLAGKLSHPQNLPQIPVKYLGPISRFDNLVADIEFDALIVISGPEPQRTIFETIILKDLRNYKGKLLMIRGLPGETAQIGPINNSIILNHLPANELSIAFKKSRFIISRSGYTTVMDILKLGKQSVLVPTPGQTEQEYLATHLQQQKWFMAVTQDEFNLETAMRKASTFTYEASGINMEKYKTILNEFVAEVAGKNNQD